MTTYSSASTIFYIVRVCPVPDTDNDGINDEEDSCITQPGVLRYHGCPVPDTDGDGINNEEDSCINIPGPKSNNGCPVIKKELTEEMQRAAQNILFKTGSYQLLRSSYPALNKVIFILNENPDLNLVIEGHTDNEGTEQSNQLLSENRSNTVLNYLKTHGIRETRLKAVAYGQMKPIDTNATPEGRARNRRVELKLNY
jgi:outer membrane protein OmpA-like peptidoglycan-associated protein